MTVAGFVPIESVEAGDNVLSFSPETQEVSEQIVEETFVNESDELIHIEVGNERISTTPNHPFYVPQKGFVKAIDLRAGDVLWTVNGEYVIVEQIQHEILESPVKVFNFRVSENHTYFVGNSRIGVHNAECSEQIINPNEAKIESLREQLPDSKYNKLLKDGSKDGNVAEMKAEIEGFEEPIYMKGYSKIGNVEFNHETGKLILNENGECIIGNVQEGWKFIFNKGRDRTINMMLFRL